MLKIGLVGAPTSGKTELAQQLEAELSKVPKGVKRATSIAVVDGYIDEIQDRSDTVLGHYASYVGNLQVAIGRWEAERLVEKDRQPEIMITCGTVIETIVYNGIAALVQNGADSGQMTARALANDKRASVSMTMLGILGVDLGNYDHLFYLPLGEDEPDEVAIVDGHIIEAAESMNMTMVTLSQDRNERLAEVLKVINEKTD